MKNIKLLFLFSVLTMLFACDADYEPLNDYSDVDWYTSKNRVEKLIGVNDYMSFADLSQNPIDHSWSFSDTSGCYFLKGNIVRQDSTFTQFIDEDLDNVSYDKSISVLFTKPGLQGIRLKNTFPSPVSFEGTDTLVAVQQGDVWVIDTTFVVDVYDTIQSAFKVYNEDLEIASVNFDQQSVLADSASWPTVEIEAGAALKFVDMTEKGRPNTISWGVGGGSPSTSSDSAAVINFYRLGTFFARHAASRTGENVPSGYKSKYVPLKIKVIKSSLPFELTGDIVEKENGTLQFSITGEMVPFANQEEFFTVHVTNPNGFDEDVEIESVSINSELGNVLDITLVEPLYSYNDVVTVSYSGGSIASLDERDLAEIVNVPVVMYNVNVLSNPAYGFEDQGAGWAPLWDNTSLIEYVTEKANSGTYSMKVTNDGGKAKVESKNVPVVLTVGTSYYYSYKVWIDASTTAASVSSWFLPDWKQNWVGIGSLPKGEWVTIEKIFTYNGNGNVQIMFTLNGDGIVYVDDFVMIEHDVRP